MSCRKSFSPSITPFCVEYTLSAIGYILQVPWNITSLANLILLENGY